MIIWRALRMSELLLARADEIGEGASKGFSVSWQGELIEGFLVQQNGELYAYRNNCPHTGAPLDWMPDQFMDVEGRYIQCSMHGALFQVEDGLCIYGPCVSRRLEPLPIEIVQDEIRLLTRQEKPRSQ